MSFFDYISQVIWPPQKNARQLFECRTPSLVHTHLLVVCRPPTAEILTENRLQRGCWVATAGDCTCITYIFSPSRPPFNTSVEFWIIWILWCTSVKPDITPVLHQCSGRYRMVGPAPLWLRGEGRGYRCWWPARPSGAHLRCWGMLPGGGGHWTMVHTYLVGWFPDPWNVIHTSAEGTCEIGQPLTTFRYYCLYSNYWV